MHTCDCFQVALSLGFLVDRTPEGSYKKYILIQLSTTGGMILMIIGECNVQFCNTQRLSQPIRKFILVFITVLGFDRMVLGRPCSNAWLAENSGNVLHFAVDPLSIHNVLWRAVMFWCMCYLCGDVLCLCVQISACLRILWTLSLCTNAPFSPVQRIDNWSSGFDFGHGT